MFCRLHCDSLTLNTTVINMLWNIFVQHTVVK